MQSTVQVYISDIAKSNEARADLISYASAIPGVALSFGPTIGGALAHYGLNVPITFDATLTLFSFFFVYLYLPETPKFRAILAARARGEPTEADKNNQKSEEDLSKKKSTATDGVSTGQSDESSSYMNVLYLEVFTRGMVFSGRIAVLAIFFEQQYGFRPLDVGIVFMVNAVVMIISTLWLTKKLQTTFGKRPAVYYSSILEACVMVAMSQGQLFDVVTDWINFYCFCPLDKFLNHAEVL